MSEAITGGQGGRPNHPLWIRQCCPCSNSMKTGFPPETMIRCCDYGYWLIIIHELQCVRRISLGQAIILVISACSHDSFDTLEDWQGNCYQRLIQVEKQTLIPECFEDFGMKYRFLFCEKWSMLQLCTVCKTTLMCFQLHQWPVKAGRTFSQSTRLLKPLLCVLTSLWVHRAVTYSIIFMGIFIF